MKIQNRKKIGVLLIILCMAIAVNAMAITITVNRYAKIGSEAIREGTINFDSSYTKDTGEAFYPSDVLLNNIRWMDIPPMTDASGNLKLFEWNDASNVVRMYDASGHVTEVSGNMSHVSGVKFRAIGY